MNHYSDKTHAGLCRLIGWLMVIGIAVLSLVPIPPATQALPGSDKLLHLCSYFVLSYWFFHTYHKHQKWVVFGFISLGFCLEMLQALTAYRYFEWLDMLMNLSGVLLAYAVFCLFKIKVKWLLVL